MNKCIVIGRVGRDAELLVTTKVPVLKFSVANDIGYGDKKKTVWFNCALFGKVANVAAEKSFFTKGKQVILIGEIDLYEYTKKDGTNGSSLNLNVNEFELIGDGPEKETQPDINF